MTRRQNKYNAKKVSEHGFTFDSKLEHSRYCQLRMLVMSGEIDGLIVHPRYIIHDSYIQSETGRKVLPIIYTADFSYVDTSTGTKVVEDVKSPPTAKKRDFVLRRKMFEARYDIKLSILFKEDIL